MREKLGSCALLVVVLSAGVAACTTSGAPAASPAAATATPTRSAATLGAGPWAPVPDRGLPAEATSAMQAEGDSWVDRKLIPGVTVAVVGPDGVWTTPAGVDGDGTPLRPDSGMALASITKTMTAAEVLLLAERGTLDLDAPASTYVRARQLSNGTTVRQLLAHRSSIAEGDPAAYATLFSELDTPWTTTRVLAPVASPTTPPGKGFRYTNVNYILLGQVITAVSGTDLATAFTRDLWRPLGLTRLAYQDAQTLAPPLARPGQTDELPQGTPKQPYLPSRSFASAFATAGAVAGDAEATARWGYALYGARLLTPRSVAQLTDFGDGDGYGLGTMDFSGGRFSTHTLDAVGHLGDLPGFRSALAVFPAGPVSVAVLTPSTVDPSPYVAWLVAAGKLTG